MSAPCHFKYKAINANGDFFHDTIQANNAYDLEKQLSAMGLDLISFKIQRAQFSLFKKPIISKRELIHFTYQMQQLTQSGISVLDSLCELKDSADTSSLKNMLSSLLDSIQNGKTLSDALASFPAVFDSVYIALIKVGEETGRLPDVLLGMADNLKWQDELAAHMQKILLYPAIVFFVIIAVLCYLLIFLVPDLMPFIQQLGGQLPAHTRALIFTSTFLQNYSAIIIISPFIFILSFYVAKHYSPNLQYRIDAIKLKAFIIGPIILKAKLARFAHYFSLMYNSGLSVIDSLKMTESLMGNVLLRNSIIDIRQRIIQGEFISQSFAQHTIYPSLVIRMLKMGETTGAMDTALLNISYFYNRDVKDSINNMQAAITPLLTVLMGGILFWIMSAVLGPIYDTLSTIH